MYPGMPALAGDAAPLQQHQEVPSAPPMHAAHANAPSGDSYSPYPQQAQQAQQYAAGPQQPYQQPYQQRQPYQVQGNSSDPLTAGMQSLNLQQPGSGGAIQQYPAAPQPNQQAQPYPALQQQQQQGPYPQPYPQQQQQQQQAPPYPQAQAQPYSQQQQAPYQAAAPYPPQQQQQQQVPYPQQQQQQQAYPQPVPPHTPPYSHSDSGNSSLYGSYPGQQQQQQQQHPYPQHVSSTGSGNSTHYGGYTAQQYGSSSSGQQYGSQNGQQYSSGHYSSCGALSYNESVGPFGGADVSRYPSVLSSGSFDGTQGPQQQQQQQGALPPYPAVPQALPVLPYNAAPEKVCQGYDVMLYIQNAKNLPAMDWWNGLADPYVIISTHVGGKQFSYRTAHKRNTKNPEFDNEFFEMGNLPVGTTFFVEVWDKDMVTDDDVIGRSTWSFCPKEMLPGSTAGGGILSADSTWGRLLVKLPLRHPSKANKNAGDIELEVCYRPSTREGQPRMLGPVRFRQHLSPNAGFLTGHWWSEADMSFMTYKLFLTNIGSVFDGVTMPWNKKYDKAVQIFKNPMVLGGVRTQHRSLYSTNIGKNRGGMLSCAQDFFELFSCGMRANERRFFTYVLCEDSLRCSETGAAFFSDMFSKHAMHSGGAEEVLFAGEFCIVPCPGAAGGHKLVIDNNSGTYAPDKSKLPLMQQLFTTNFPDMTVEVLDMKDPRLLEYQKACPSRLVLAAAAANK